MKILKYLCLIIVMVLINCELFDLVNWQFHLINVLTGLYIGLDSIELKS